MKSLAITISRLPWSGQKTFLGVSALSLGVIAALLAGHSAVLLGVAAFAAYGFLAVASLRQPLIFVTIFLAALILLPPIYLRQTGETPIYVTTLLLPIGAAVLWLRFADFRLRPDPIARGLILFLLATALSLPFAWWLSGPQVGNQSFLRWLMLAQTVLVYWLVRGGARRQESRLERVLITVLVTAAALTAAYGILDFVWPVPYPHPAADEYIWLRTSIMRRAQGVFYEAGNFANLCGLFLAVVVSAILARRERLLRVPLAGLLALAAALSVAVFVSFTRSTWVSVLVAVLAFAIVSRGIDKRRACLVAALPVVPIVFLRIYSLGLWDYLVSSRLGNLAQLLVDPNLASSGRWDNWARVLNLLAGHPQFWLFGVGFKTLPYTGLFHQPIIMDNGYLNLLLEGGLIGLAGFGILSAAIFKTFARMAGTSGEAARFWGAALFSFWCGECVQMMALDAYTYWRTLTVLAALMALAMNRMERIKGAEVRQETGNSLPFAARRAEP